MSDLSLYRSATKYVTNATISIPFADNLLLARAAIISGEMLPRSLYRLPSPFLSGGNTPIQMGVLQRNPRPCNEIPADAKRGATPRNATGIIDRVDVEYAHIGWRAIGTDNIPGNLTVM